MQTELERQHARHKQFHSSIAFRASQLRPIVKHTYEIPNAPYGVPKILPHRSNFELKIDRRPVPDSAYDEAWFGVICGIHELPKRITVKLIQGAVCRFYDLRHNDFISARRTKNLVRPRFVAYALCKHFTSKSLPELGRAFGNRDHTTILNGLRKFEILRARGDSVADDFEAIKEML